MSDSSVDDSVGYSPLDIFPHAKDILNCVKYTPWDWWLVEGNTPIVNTEAEAETETKLSTFTSNFISQR